jgi:hypothetical protein
MGDLIAGLPGDKLEDIHKRMDWVLKHDAFDSLMLYPLSLLASPELHPHRSFLVFSRTQGLIWKWPDPRESHSLELPDGQKIPSHPVCCVATSGEAIPEWFTNHMSKRYPSLPDMRLWRPPEDNTPTLNSSILG